MAHRHHLAVVRVRGRLELVGNARRGERVVAAGVERLRQAGEEAGAVVADGARLAVQELARVADLAAEDLDDRLVAEADAERRRRRREPADDLLRRARVARPAGTGGDRRAARVRGRAAPSASISSLRRTVTSTPSAPKRCARLYVNES